jgi:hypothetical protein
MDASLRWHDEEDPSRHDHAPSVPRRKPGPSGTGKRLDPGLRRETIRFGKGDFQGMID